MDTSGQLADGIKEIERLQKELIQREKELAILEDKLKRENAELSTKYLNENNVKINAIKEKEKAEEELELELNKAYSLVHTIIYGSFCREFEYINTIGIKKWLDIDEFYHEIGKKLKYDDDEINDSAFEFIEIYAYFKLYRMSYNYMESMAKKNDTWVYINEDTFKWACEQNEGWKVINVMEDNLKNNRIKYEHIRKYEEKIEKLKKIRGF